MRRKDREIKDLDTIKKIIERAAVCHIAMCSNGVPYLAPMNFGFDGENVYLHSFPEGKKIDILKENPQLCIGITENLECITSAESVCETSMKYSSVIINGKAEFIAEKKEKIEALKYIVQQYYRNMDDEKKYSTEKLLENYSGELAVFRVKIEKITGKQSN